MGDASDDHTGDQGGDGEETINDPLTRTDVEAPRAPFGGERDADGDSEG